MQPGHHQPGSWRHRVYVVIFRTDTPAGKAFDVALIASILLSVLVVALSSVAALNNRFGGLFLALEWLFTALYTLEYILRVLVVSHPARYVLSFYGLVDLLAVLPTWLTVIFPGGQFFLLLRLLRVLRLFRVLKLVQYIDEVGVLMSSLAASRRKILVFLFMVSVLLILFGSLMYLVEGEAGGFTSIPISIYWAVVTLTTVGYGDISPQTPLGQALSSLVMILGYAIIAVPTGIVTVELSRQERLRQPAGAPCAACGRKGHDPDAAHCKYCGAQLDAAGKAEPEPEAEDLV